MRLRRVLQRAAPEGEPRQPRARPRMLVPRSPPQPGREEGPVRLHGHREGLCSQHPRPQLCPPAPSLCRRPADWAPVLHAACFGAADLTGRSPAGWAGSQLLAGTEVATRAWDLPSSLRPYRPGFSLRQGQNLEASSRASFLAPGAVSCARGCGAEGGQLGRAAGCRTVCAPKPEDRARPCPSTPTRNQGDGQGLPVSAIHLHTAGTQEPCPTLLA